MKIITRQDTIRYLNQIIRHPKRKPLDALPPQGPIPGGIGQGLPFPVEVSGFTSTGYGLHGIPYNETYPNGYEAYPNVIYELDNGLWYGNVPDSMEIGNCYHTNYDGATVSWWWRRSNEMFPNAPLYTSTPSEFQAGLSSHSYYIYHRGAILATLPDDFMCLGACVYNGFLFVMATKFNVAWYWRVYAIPVTGTNELTLASPDWIQCYNEFRNPFGIIQQFRAPPAANKMISIFEPYATRREIYRVTLSVIDGSPSATLTKQGFDSFQDLRADETSSYVDATTACDTQNIPAHTQTQACTQATGYYTYCVGCPGTPAELEQIENRFAIRYTPSADYNGTGYSTKHFERLYDMVLHQGGIDYTNYLLAVDYDDNGNELVARIKISLTSGASRRNENGHTLVETGIAIMEAPSVTVTQRKVTLTCCLNEYPNSDAYDYEFSPLPPDPENSVINGTSYRFAEKKANVQFSADLEVNGTVVLNLSSIDENHDLVFNDPNTMSDVGTIRFEMQHSTRSYGGTEIYACPTGCPDFPPPPDPCGGDEQFLTAYTYWFTLGGSATNYTYPSGNFKYCWEQDWSGSTLGFEPSGTPESFNRVLRSLTYMNLREGIYLYTEKKGKVSELDGFNTWTWANETTPIGDPEVYASKFVIPAENRDESETWGSLDPVLVNNLTERSTTNTEFTVLSMFEINKLGNAQYEDGTNNETGCATHLGSRLISFVQPLPENHGKLVRAILLNPESNAYTVIQLSNSTPQLGVISVK
jgi:hypothetical protein